MTANQILFAHFERKKRVGYSLRALARDLKVSATFVSAVFRGKKRVPLKLVGPMARILDIDSETVLEIKRQIVPDAQLGPAKKSSAASRWEPAPKSEFPVALRQWFYIAIMELTSCRDFDGTMDYLAERLELSRASVEVAVRELCWNGLLEVQEGKIVKATALLRLSSAQSQEEIRAFHRQMLKKASEALASAADFERRLITGITVTADPERIAIAKKMLSDSLHEIAAFLSDGNAADVYHLSAQLFPLTKKRV